MKKILIPNNAPADSVSNLLIEDIDNNDIAVVGMAGRFGKATDLQEYWEHLANGTDFVGPLARQRQQDIEAFYDQQTFLPPLTGFREGGFLSEIDRLDYELFKLTPKEARLMDPRQRLFLRSAWQAIEDAGYGGGKLDGSSTGVYVGCSGDMEEEYYRFIQLMETKEIAMAIPGNVKSIIASRISYLLNLNGPSMVIDTACSSSLVALHVACKAILNQECDMALAGGVKTYLFPLEGPDHLGLSSTRTRSFDDSSEGPGIGEGHAAVLLKPLYRAIWDKDHIYAVIKGSAVNQDGASLGITAPNVQAQEKVILKAWKDARVDPSTITLWEAHGTGTKLGDPIEAEAVKRAFSHFTDKKQFCALGSVKTNIGHLDGAAGIAGFCKAILALKHKKIPPMLNFTKPNREIAFEDSPLYINDKAVEWETNGGVRRCGISAFGLSGTNCHMVLEEYSPTQALDRENNSPWNLLVLSARSHNGLRLLVKQIQRMLATPDGPSLEDICYTMATVRTHNQVRTAIIARNKKQCLERLEQWLNDASEEEMAASDEDLNMTADVRVTVSVPESELYYREASRLAESYLAGQAIDWETFYQGRPGNRVSAPVTPFEQQRCWVSSQHVADSLLHQIEWRPIDLPSLAFEQQSPSRPGSVLFFCGRYGKSTEICRSLEQKGHQIVIVHLGASTSSQLGNETFEISGEEADYEWLLEQVSAIRFSKVVYCISEETDQSPSAIGKRAITNVTQLYHLTRAVCKMKWTHEIELLLIGWNINEVNGKERALNPAGNAVFGFGRSIQQEYANLRCRALDIGEEIIMPQIIHAVSMASDYYLLAYRQGQIYTEVVEKFSRERYPVQNIPLRDDGVYLITGGTGELGLETARFLSSRKRIRLALTCRRPFPDRTQWQAIIDAGMEIGRIRQLRALMEIEQDGSTVEVYSADIADQVVMSELYEQLKIKYKRVRGVVHCAGVGGEYYIVRKSAASMNAVLYPKILGTVILDSLLQDEPLDFFIMYSSISALTGGPGQADYAAANAFMDAYSCYRRRNGRSYTSINWVKWAELGMGNRSKIDAGSTAYGDVAYEELMPHKASKMFEEILKRQMANVIVGEAARASDKQDLHSKAGSGYAPIEPLGNSIRGSSEVELLGGEVKGYTEIQRILGSAWSEVLGREQISIHDNFHQLGGDSIATTQLTRKLNEYFPDKVHIVDIYSYPTISELASYLEGILDSAPGTTPASSISNEHMSLDVLMERFKDGEITAEQLDQLIKKGGAGIWKK
ncbi:beta-ketoacyl synthase N-terminal-like domain-containing protein [Paenibacillus sp. 2TAF8]|jgi:acyl transferase domain-containing protein/acyl carrier protein|uniref:beta-ketoacyl synthase N-terminal-like domain-containing protein n=1 Tax=Paenibacillus sp. 2TAF8 TaxID=3233020 RepID=UPI003F9E83DA